jgi:hypothetical protein
MATTAPQTPFAPESRFVNALNWCIECVNFLWLPRTIRKRAVGFAVDSIHFAMDVFNWQQANRVIILAVLQRITWIGISFILPTAAAVIVQFLFARVADCTAVPSFVNGVWTIDQTCSVHTSLTGKIFSFTSRFRFVLIGFVFVSTLVAQFSLVFVVDDGAVSELPQWLTPQFYVDCTADYVALFYLWYMDRCRQAIVRPYQTMAWHVLRLICHDEREIIHALRTSRSDVPTEICDVICSYVTHPQLDAVKLRKVLHTDEIRERWPREARVALAQYIIDPLYTDVRPVDLFQMYLDEKDVVSAQNERKLKDE